MKKKKYLIGDQAKNNNLSQSENSLYTTINIGNYYKDPKIIKVNVDSHSPVYINDNNVFDCEFQNSTNFMMGLKLINKYGTPKSKRVAEEVLNSMDKLYKAYDDCGVDEDIVVECLFKKQEYSEKICFFCELGVWNTKLENPKLHDKVFPKYFNNVCWNYFIQEEPLSQTEMKQLEKDRERRRDTMDMAKLTLLPISLTKTTPRP